MAALLAAVSLATAERAVPPAAAGAAAAGGRAPRPAIVWKPIPFTASRKAETAAYARRHYGIDRWRLIHPKVIVEHYTANESFPATWNTFAADSPDPELNELPGDCAHFVIDTDGTIYQLVSLSTMCRHTVGLNYTSIGIENVGTSDGEILSNPRQLSASIRLTLWLMQRFRIELANVIGHNESLGSPFHHELVAAWRCQTHGDWQASDMRVYRSDLVRQATAQRRSRSGHSPGRVRAAARGSDRPARRRSAGMFESRSRDGVDPARRALPRTGQPMLSLPRRAVVWTQPRTRSGRQRSWLRRLRRPMSTFRRRCSTCAKGRWRAFSPPRTRWSPSSSPFTGSPEARSTTAPASAFRSPDGQFAVMACVDRELGYAGLKSYAWTTSGTPFVVLLFSLERPRLEAVIEADKLGQLRTGAASGVAAGASRARARRRSG